MRVSSRWKLKTSRLVIGLSSLVVLTVPGLIGQDERRSVHKVEFLAVGSDGTLVDYVVASLELSDSKKEFVQECAGPICRSLYPGQYNVTFTSRDGRQKLFRRVVLSRTEEFVTVDAGEKGRGFGPSLFSRFEIRGTVSGLPRRTTHRWVRFDRMYGDGQAEAILTEDGRFRIEGVEPGNWLLSAYDEGRLVALKPVKVSRTKPPDYVQIDLNVDLSVNLEQH
jgi:hypothetical protein